ncbi:MAG: hypothetical protein Q9209_000999 [Squamulea sp. 1 TL-2023]
MSSNTNQRAFPFAQNARFTNLTSLSVSRYDWNHTRSPWIDSIIGTPPRSNAESWRDVMDWAKLEILDIELPPTIFLDTFKDQLSSLRSLTFRPQWGFWGNEGTICDCIPNAKEMRNAYVSFISGLSPLHKLSISGTGQLLSMDPLLHKHGHSLRSLTIHEFERDCTHQAGNETWTRPSMTLEELKRLRNMAPSPDSLTLDLYRERGQWPTEALDVVSTFDNVTDLTVHVDLEDPTRMTHADPCYTHRRLCVLPELMEPRLNFNVAQSIFRHFRQQQHTKQLRHLQLVAGDYARRKGGGLRSFHYHPNEPVMYRCRVESDGSNFCIVPNCFEDMDDEDW